MSIGRLEAMRIYEDYHCRGNTMNTSVEDMAYIIREYKDEIPSWQKKFNELDETVYDFDDSEFEKYIRQGKDNAKNATGYKDNFGDKVGQYGRATVDTAVSVGNAGAAFIANGGIGIGAYKIGEKTAENAAVGIGNVVGKEATQEAAKATGEAAAKETAKNAGQSFSCIVGCVMGAATAAAYWIKNPNKDQVEAAEQVEKIHQENMSNLAAAQSNMQTMSEELSEAAEEAENINEEANNLIVEKKTEYDRFNATRNSIKSKAESGQKISGSEKGLYKEVSVKMSEAGEDINNTVDETSNAVGDIQSDMFTYQEGFDEAAGVMGTTQGVTEYAAGFDKGTEVLCYVEGGAQALNAASSAIAGARAAALATSGAWFFGSTAWAYVFAVMGFAAAASSGVASGQQFTWASKVHKEIETRGQTEELNTNTLDVYNVEVDNYDLALSDVDSLEIIMPDDISAPTDTEITVPDENKPEPENIKKTKGNTK